MKGKSPTDWLLLAIVLLGGWLLSRHPLERLQTDVTALLPASEHDPAVQVIRSLATQRQARTVLLHVEAIDSSERRETLLRVVPEELKSHSVIAEIWSLERPSFPAETLAVWREHSVAWFWPDWWIRHGASTDADALAAQSVSALNTFLDRPESFLWEDSLPEDPLLLVPASLQALSAILPEESENTATNRLRWWLRMDASPFVPEAQEALFAALADATESIAAVAPAARIEASGVAHLAHASETAIRAEVARLNWLAGGTVLLLGLLFVRRWRLAGPLAVILATSLLGGGAVVFTCFAQIHVITLVIGAILLGVAIDYGLHVFLHPSVDPPAARWEGVRRPLLVGSLSTIGGFGLLLWTDLPLLRHLGVFMGAGLLAALVASALYARFGPIVETPVRRLPVFRFRLTARLWIPAAGVALLLLAGLSRLEWIDDIRSLNLPQPRLEATDAALRAAFQGPTRGERWLLAGEKWQTLHDTAAQLPAGTTSLAAWAASPETMLRAHAAAQNLQLVEAWRTALDAEGYEPEAFAPFFEQWENWRDTPLDAARAEQLVSARLESLPGPAGLLGGGEDDFHWWIVESPTPLEPTTAEGVHLIPLAQLESLNAVFTRYREQAWQAALFGLGALAVGLLLGYGLRRGVRLLAFPALPAALVLGGLGWQGAPLNLFHLLGAFLGVCLTLDYLVFALKARDRADALPPSITLSALTTAGSFGWLATSPIPAVAALGFTVASTVALAWVLALGLTALPSATVPDRAA